MRYISEPLRAFAQNKFVLVSGPRQVGKTTLCNEWAKSSKSSLSLNWDIPEERTFILNKNFISEIENRGIEHLMLDEL